MNMSIKDSRIKQSPILQMMNCATFITFLKENGYEVKKANPNHVPGEGYSSPSYYENVNLGTAIAHFKKHFNDFLPAWEQFKKDNWWESEAVDVEKLLMAEFLESHRL